MSTLDRLADRLLIRAVRDSGRWLAALLVAALTVAAAELLLPTVLGRAVDAAVNDTRPARWLGAAAGLVGLIVAADVCTDLAAGNGSARATARLRHTLVRHMLALDLRAAARWRDGDLVSRIVGQVAQAGQAGPAVVAAVAVALPSVGSLVALALIDVWLAVAFVAGMLVLGGLLRAFVTDLADTAARYQRAQGDIAARLVEALAGRIARKTIQVPGVRAATVRVAKQPKRMQPISAAAAVIRRAKR